MLHVEYMRDLHNNYLVIKGIKDTYGYRTKILLNNEIEGLLHMEQKYIDQMDLFYYDITNKKSLTNVFENKSLQYEDIKKLLLSILTVVNRCEEYLLSENDFILDPEFIFLGDQVQNYSLCYLEGYQTNMLTQFSKLMEYLMNKVDYKDENAVVLTYGLYKVSREEDCTYEKLMKELDKILPKQGCEENTQKVDKKNRSNGEFDPNIEIKDQMEDSELISRSSGDYKLYNNIRYKKDNTRNKDVSYYKDGKITKDRKRSKDKTSYNVKSTNKDNRTNQKNHTLLSNIFENIRMNQSVIWNLGSKKRNKGKNIHDLTEANHYSQRSSNSTQKNEYPFIEEVQFEKEIELYDKKTYAIAVGAILLGFIFLVLLFKLKLLHNSFGTRIDNVKLVGCLLILGSIEIYILSKLFNPKNKITKIITKEEYMEPEHIQSVGQNIAVQTSLDIMEADKPRGNMNYSQSCNKDMDEGQEDTVVLWMEEDDSDKTKVLVDFTAKQQYYLESNDPISNGRIPVTEFPFIIGKLAAGVNYRLQDEAVSRRHVKFIKEKEDIFIIDLASTNGTFLNGIKLNHHKLYKLSDNDEIVIAHIKFYWRKK